MDIEKIINSIIICADANTKIKEIEAHIVLQGVGRKMYIFTKFMNRYYSFEQWKPIISNFNNLSEEARQDCFQDAEIAFTQALANGKYNGVAKLSSYFRTILWNKLVNAANANLPPIVSLPIDLPFKDPIEEEGDLLMWKDAIKQNMEACIKKMVIHNPKHIILLLAKFNYKYAEITNIVAKAQEKHEEVALSEEIISILAKLENISSACNISQLKDIFGYASNNAISQHINTAKIWLKNCCK